MSFTSTCVRLLCDREREHGRRPSHSAHLGARRHQAREHDPHTMLNGMAMSSQLVHERHVAFCEAHQSDCTQLHLDIAKAAVVGVAANGALLSFSGAQLLELLSQAAALGSGPALEMLLTRRRIHAKLAAERDEWVLAAVVAVTTLGVTVASTSSAAVLPLIATVALPLYIGAGAAADARSEALANAFADELLAMSFNLGLACCAAFCGLLCYLRIPPARQRARASQSMASHALVAPRAPVAGDLCVICLTEMLPLPRSLPPTLTHPPEKVEPEHERPCRVPLDLDFCPHGCGQAVHRACVKGWLRLARRCPLCSAPWLQAGGTGTGPARAG